LITVIWPVLELVSIGSWVNYQLQTSVSIKCGDRLLLHSEWERTGKEATEAYFEVYPDIYMLQPRIKLVSSQILIRQSTFSFYTDGLLRATPMFPLSNIGPKSGYS